MNKPQPQRNFVPASDPAKYRAKGVKRQGGAIKDTPQDKHTRKSIDEFAKPSTSVDPNVKPESEVKSIRGENTSLNTDSEDYFNELSKIPCLDLKFFKPRFFLSLYGELVLIVRPWESKMSIIAASCMVCEVKMQTTFKDGTCTLYINDEVVASAQGNKKTSKQLAVEQGFEVLKNKVVIVLVKERWIPQDNARIEVKDVSQQHAEAEMETIGTEMKGSVAMKMMKMMGWKGGGLGAFAQGIADHIQPQLRLVERAGLGSDIEQLAKAAGKLMDKYKENKKSLDVDLVFSSEFREDEREALHRCAFKKGLQSKSYGQSPDRFLVVKLKLSPYQIATEVVKRGGSTDKYEVFLPAGLHSKP